MENFPERKQHRLPKQNYSAPGAYFITICTYGKAKILSTIVGEGFPLPKSDIIPVGEGSPLPKKKNYIVQLTLNGEIVERIIKDVSNRYPDINVESYVIMPNHIHLLMTKELIHGRGDPSPTLGTNVLDVIGWMKFLATKEINLLKGTKGLKVFQRSFYDHIVRNEQDYNEIVKYIEENPLKWQMDDLFI